MTFVSLTFFARSTKSRLLVAETFYILCNVKLVASRSGESNLTKQFPLCRIRNIYLVKRAISIHENVVRRVVFHIKAQLCRCGRRTVGVVKNKNIRRCPCFPSLKRHAGVTGNSCRGFLLLVHCLKAKAFCLFEGWPFSAVIPAGTCTV